MPCFIIAVVQVGNNTLRKFNQRKSQECPLRIGGPSHVGGGGLLAARAARVISAHTSSGGAGGRSRSTQGRGLRTEHCQCYAGVRTVGSIN